MSELLLKPVDLLLGWFLEGRRKKKALVEEFKGLKRRVLYVGIVNYLPVELHKLRAFFIENGLVERPGVKEFFSEWLTAPFVERGTSAVIPFSKETIEKLCEQLDALQF